MRFAAPRALTGRPTVSVVIPHYNYGRYLPTAVASALDQKDVDVEVIIVDDRSTDGSVEVARRLAAADDRITLVEHEQNLRHIRTYNDGLSRATGDYVVLLSADDALTTDSLTRAVALMEAHPSVGLVYGGVDWFEGDPPAARGGRVRWQVWPGEQWVRRVVRRGRNCIVNPEAVLRRSVYEQAGGYDPDFPHAADMYLWLQAATVADVGFVGGPRQAYYRIHGANMHSIQFGGAADDMRQAHEVFERFFERDGAVLPQADRLRQAARRSVAREALLRAAFLEATGEVRSSAVELQDFARGISPDAVHSAAWRWTVLAGARSRLVRRVEGLRWKVRYRRDQAVGL